MSIASSREAAPLVHYITNYVIAVIANFTANSLLAIRTPPIMANEISELS